MKICILIPSLKSGGAERVLSILASEFVKLGHDVDIVLTASDEVFYDLAEEVNVHKICYPYKGALSKVHASFRVAVRMRKVIKEVRPDCIVSFLEKYNELNLLCTRFLNVPVIVSDRNNPSADISSLRVFFKKATYSWAQGVVAQTTKSKETIQLLLNNKLPVHVIENPIREVIRYPNIERQNVILNIGRLVEQKGHEDLIRAFALLPDKKWKLCILGEGYLRNSLEELISQMNLEGRVEMPGTQRNVDEYFARSSIFVLSSYFEGFPNALCEAMAAGLACVSTDCPTGPSELVNSKFNGLLTEVGNINDLACALRQLAEDEDLRSLYGSEASKIVSRLDSEEIAKQWLDFIQEIIHC
ncbi:Glycosyltransferase involved in cell wall bisynthesis [Rubritalea squalenifaciens DSM 18772]|uniref:Glycosyltransferase involved in cell wall bisynthesis n=1 Tax=Rubritalea squalenifaciens DSM 18772 TaxID=1123071 RepID=A0A1M6QYS7_9BACT|nr:glycosyltransferase family 4 protein [Rubritalea squalenifaciens]SHK25385.1 Glycosyltransferase involved in cell wall bisynthesis [Rubritalea squalenifaciens DSM 18772]